MGLFSRKTEETRIINEEALQQTLDQVLPILNGMSVDEIELVISRLREVVEKMKAKKMQDDLLGGLGLGGMLGGLMGAKMPSVPQIDEKKGGA